jgi:hypothetical protein
VARPCAFAALRSPLCAATIITCAGGSPKQGLAGGQTLRQAIDAGCRPLDFPDWKRIHIGLLASTRLLAMLH